MAAGGGGPPRPPPRRAWGPAPARPPGVGGFRWVSQMPRYGGRGAVPDAGRALDLFDAANWQANVHDGGEFQSTFLRDAEAFVRGRGARHHGHSAAPMLGDSALAGAGDKVLIICASGRPTPRSVTVQTRHAQRPNWMDFAHAAIDDQGDGRVWLPSAAVKGVRLAAFTDSGDHGLLCRDPRVAGLTARWLQGRPAVVTGPDAAGNAQADREFPIWDGRRASLRQHVA